MGLRETTVTNIGWTALSQIAVVGLSPVLLLVVAHILSPQDFGVYAACLIVIGLAQTLTLLSLDYAAIQSKEDWNEVVSTALILRISLSVIAIACIVLLSPIISALFHMGNLELPLLILSLSLLVLAFTFPPQVHLAKYLRFKEISKARIAQSLVWSAAVLVLAVIGALYWSLILASMLSLVAFMISVWLTAGRKVNLHFSRRTAANLVRFGGILTAGSFVYLLSTNIDKILVGSMIGPVELGVYWLMYSYGTTAPTFMTNVVNTVMFPTYVSLQRESEGVKRAYLETIRITSEFSAIMAFGLAGGAYLFVSVLLGDNWIEGATSLAILSIAGLFISLTSPAANLFISKGKPELVFWLTLACIIPMIPILIVSIAFLGIIGASLTVLIYEGGKCLLVLNKAGKLLDVRNRQITSEILPPIIAGMATALCIIMIQLLLGATVIALIIAGGLGLVTYFAIITIASHGKFLEDIKEGIGIVRRAAIIKKTD